MSDIRTEVLQLNGLTDPEAYALTAIRERVAGCVDLVDLFVGCGSTTNMILEALLKAETGGKTLLVFEDRGTFNQTGDVAKSLAKSVLTHIAGQNRVLTGNVNRILFSDFQEHPKLHLTEWFPKGGPATAVYDHAVFERQKEFRRKNLLGEPFTDITTIRLVGDKWVALDAEEDMVMHLSTHAARELATRSPSISFEVCGRHFAGE